VGVVTAINGQSRVKVGFVGKAGHAGTVPMGGGATPCAPPPSSCWRSRQPRRRSRGLSLPSARSQRTPAP
jgi:hypothetical protein